MPSGDSSSFRVTFGFGFMQQIRDSGELALLLAGAQRRQAGWDIGLGRSMCASLGSVSSKANLLNYFSRWISITSRTRNLEISPSLGGIRDRSNRPFGTNG